MRGRLGLWTVQAHRADDHRSALRHQRDPVGGKPLVRCQVLALPRLPVNAASASALAAAPINTAK